MAGSGQQQQQQQRQQQRQERRYDPAREAQDMLEDMITKHRRYKKRVGFDTRGTGSSNGVGYYGGTARFENGDEMSNNAVNNKYDEWIHGSWSSSSLSFSSSRFEDEVNRAANLNIDDNKTDTHDPHWFEPRPDELMFPPNTINYNSVLNAWSRASRYDADAAMRAEDILLKRMEASVSLPMSSSFSGDADDESPDEGGGDGGDENVHPDALSYALVIHAWLRGCRGTSSNSTRDSGRIDRGNHNRHNQPYDAITQQKVTVFTDLDRIERAMGILDRLEAWARREAVHHRRHSSREWSSRGERSVDYNDTEREDDDDEYKAESTASNILDDDIELVDDFDLIDSGDGTLDDNGSDYENRYRTRSVSSYKSNRKHDKARDLDVDVYNAIIVAYSREHQSNVDHAATVMRLLDRMESLAIELGMPSVQPNQRSYNIALGVIVNSAARLDTSLASYYKDNACDRNLYADNEALKKKKSRPINPLYTGMAAENILSRMLSNNHRPDAYTFASVLNTYQRIPGGRLEAALAADGVVRGMESLHLHGRIIDPPDVFHYTMLCACWSRSGGRGEHQRDVSVVNPGERCSEILRHMQERHADGYPRVKPNIRTYNAVIDSFAYSGKLEEAESMLFSMIDNFESSARRSMLDGIEDTELPVRPDSFSFNTVIQQWARARSPDGGRRAEIVLDRMLDFHHNGNADVRPDERSFAYIIYHYTKGAGRVEAKAPDRALKLLRKMVRLYRQGYKELLPSYQNKTNPIFAFTSVIDAHSILRRPDSGTIGDELLNDMMLLGKNINALRPNTYACLSVLYAWSSCGSVDAGERATELLLKMEQEMAESAKRGKEARMRTTQRCFILAQTAWARGTSERKAEGALEVLKMMEKSYANGNTDARPTVQAFSMVLNACAFADSYQDETGDLVKASPEKQLKAFHVAETALNRICKEPYPRVLPNPVIFGTFIKCCGRLDLPDALVEQSATRVFCDCCRAGFVSDFVLTQLRCALSPNQFLNVLVKNGYNLDKTGRSMSRDGKRIRHIGINELPREWTRHVESNYKFRNKDE